MLNIVIQRGMQDALFWSLLIGGKRVIHTLEQSPCCNTIEGNPREITLMQCIISFIFFSKRITAKKPETATTTTVS